MKIKSTMGNGVGYTNKNGRDVFPYAIVSATPSELALYKKITPKGVYKETAEGHPLFFASESYGDTATLQFNFAKTNVYCVEKGQRKAVISQMKASGIDVNKSAQAVLSQMFSGKTFMSESTESEATEESEPKTESKPKVVVKRTATKKVTAKGIGKVM